jgi:hypothetical protein
MRLPIRRSLPNRLDDLIAALKALPRQGQAVPWRPPRLDLVQPAGILRQSQPRHLRPGQLRGRSLTRDVGAQMVPDQAPLPRGRRLQDQLPTRHDAGTVPPWTAQGRRQAAGGLERTEHPHTAAPAIGRGQGGPARAIFPDLTRKRLGTHRPERVEAEDPPRRARLRVGLEDGPLVSVQAASTRTGNQLCWRFHTKPSACSHFQRVDAVTQSPGRSWSACWSRTSVPSANGTPRLRGLVRARAITGPRAVASCRHGRLERGASAKPAWPCWLQRWSQARTRQAERPTWRARAGTFSPWALAPMIWARGTSRWGTVRAWAHRVSSGASSPVNVRTLTALRCPPSRFERDVA